MSPSRPRQHEIDEECRRAFQNYIPSAWVNRPVEDDYGIDREVEIFDNHRTTGLIFKVQLKGSDSEQTTPQRRIKVDSLAYWKSLPVPVLIVYNMAATDSLYGRWAHSVPAPVDDDQETMTIHFSEKHRLTGNAQRLMEDVVVERDIGMGRWPRPIPVSVSLQPWAGGPTETEFRVHLRSLLGSQGMRRMIDVDELADYALHISISEHEIFVQAPVEVASWRWTLDDTAVVERSNMGPGLWAVVLCCSMVLLCCKNFEAGLTVFSKASSETDRARSWEFLEHLAQFLLRENRTEDVIRTIAPLLIHQEAEVRENAMLLILPVFPDLDHVSQDGQALLDDLMHQSAEIDAGDNPTGAGTTHYNLAKLAQLRRAWGESKYHLEVAVALYPEYEDRAYFHREMGASNYETGNYREAARDYRRAVELGANPTELAPLLADCLMWAGQYEQALTTLEAQPLHEHRLSAFAELTKIALRALIEVTQLREQERRPIQEIELPQGSDKAGRALSLAKSHDALDVRLWPNIPVNSPHVRAGVFVLASLVLKRVGMAWAHSCIALFSLGDTEGVQHAADYAFFHCPIDFLLALQELRTGRGERIQASLLDLIYSRGEHHALPLLPFTLRLNGEPVTFEE